MLWELENNSFCTRLMFILFMVPEHILCFFLRNQCEVYRIHWITFLRMKVKKKSYSAYFWNNLSDWKSLCTVHPKLWNVNISEKGTIMFYPFPHWPVPSFFFISSLVSYSVLCTKQFITLFLAIYTYREDTRMEIIIF